MSLYFLDTYALFELFKGNENYKKYREGIAVVTTSLNLMEFYYILLRINAENPGRYYDKMIKYVINPAYEVIKEAAQFRFAHKSKDLSYVDSIGYILALKRNAKFLTGDKQFEDMENVEFVK